MIASNKSAVANAILVKFMERLDHAHVVSLDNGPLLTSWNTHEITGHVENLLIMFSWTDGENDFSCAFDEGGISCGEFEADGTFICEDNEGDLTKIRMFTLSQLADVVAA